MIKKIIIALILIIQFIDARAQFDKPQAQIGIGFNIPFDQLKGEFLQSEMLGGFYVLTINNDFMTKNYAAKNGLSFFGKAKINFDTYSIVRGTFGISYNTFNIFESSKSGNIGVVVQNINNKIDTVLTSITYDYGFSNFGMGLGLEIAPSSFTKLISPFFGGSFNFNFMSGELSRTENRYDSVKTNFSDFRMGVNLEAGLEVNVTSNVSIAGGYKYEFGNLLLKNTNSSIADAIEFGKSNAVINDEQGRFFSSIYGPVINSVRKEVISEEKKLNWGTIFLGVNINLFEPEKSKKKKTTTK
ncbi:MAG: hypothetical protein HGGPFJEG_01857 [Ignavibacteria bacterium]|nr:hypothetical protein [Ignavibacteria bacterium]